MMLEHREFSKSFKNTFEYENRTISRETKIKIKLFFNKKTNSINLKGLLFHSTNDEKINNKTAKKIYNETGLRTNGGKVFLSDNIIYNLDGLKLGKFKPSKKLKSSNFFFLVRLSDDDKNKMDFKQHIVNHIIPHEFTVNQNIPADKIVGFIKIDIQGRIPKEAFNSYNYFQILHIEVSSLIIKLMNEVMGWTIDFKSNYSKIFMFNEESIDDYT